MGETVFTITLPRKGVRRKLCWWALRLMIGPLGAGLRSAHNIPEA